jgi:MYXO-CTERM domain-containing protein
MIARGNRAARVLTGTALALLLAPAPAAAISRCDVIADAQSWVDAQVPYSQGPWGSYCAWDYCYTDPRRGNQCYRSDCSGFVSATWGLAAPGLTTYTIDTVSHEIGWDELEPGDAVVKYDQHIMLFKEWAGGSTFYVYEEYLCGSPASIRLHDRNSMSGYVPIRYDHIEPCNAPPRGYLDAAGCDAVTGWAQDTDASDAPIAVHLYFNGAAGDPAATAFAITADVHRDDLCSAIGSCNHGFTYAVPPRLRDGQAHPVHAYGIDTAGGANAELADSPRSFTCPPPTPPLDAAHGVKRWVTDPAAFDAWRLAYPDVALLDPAVVAAYPDGPNLPAAPAVVQADDGTPEVWVIDAVAGHPATRRHVIDPASLTAWKFGGTVARRPAAEVYQNPVGLPWRPAPFAFQGNGQPQVYLLDDAPPPAATDGGVTSRDGGRPATDGGGGGDGELPTPDGGAGPAPSGDGGDGLSRADGMVGACGCRAAGGPASGAGLLAVLLGLVARRTRRR